MKTYDRSIIRGFGYMSLGILNFTDFTACINKNDISFRLIKY